MNTELSKFAANVREMIVNRQSVNWPSAKSNRQFDELALELFALQFTSNSAYQKICRAKNRTPETVEHWTQIPFVPTGAFKELELTSIPANERTAVFHSSGTTEQKPSRHSHCAESLSLYEASLWNWFEKNVLASPEPRIQNPELICLTPTTKAAPNSSLVHMFETVRQKLNLSEDVFTGEIAEDKTWNLNFAKTLAALENQQSAIGNPRLLLGTAFSFVHLLDFLAENNLSFRLPKGSRVMETGGYKNRSRTMPKAELHSLIEKFLGVPRENIICEYGMSELSSQAYDSIENEKLKMQNGERIFHFPDWAKVQIISPEAGREVADGETGLIRIFDLANVFSVAAIQTEDLGVRRGDEGFELIGRAQLAEPRGCSLMTNL